MTDDELLSRSAELDRQILAVPASKVVRYWVVEAVLVVGIVLVTSLFIFGFFVLRSETLTNHRLGIANHNDIAVVIAAKDAQIKSLQTQNAAYDAVVQKAVGYLVQMGTELKNAGLPVPTITLNIPPARP